jgi:hypothetical protein
MDGSSCSQVISSSLEGGLRVSRCMGICWLLILQREAKACYLSR